MPHFLPLLRVLVSISLVTAQAAKQTFRITSNCQDNVELYIGGFLNRNLSFAQSSVFENPYGLDPGPFSIRSKSSQDDTPVAYFFNGLNVSSYYLYAKDLNFDNATGLRVEPNSISNQNNSNCQSIECPGAGCTTTKLSGNDPNNSSSGIGHCPLNNAGFDLTLCPNTTDNGRFLMSNVSKPFNSECLDVNSANQQLQISPCKKSSITQRWVIPNKNNTSLQLESKNMCIQVNTNLTATIPLPLTIEKCNATIPGQQWNYNATSHKFMTFSNPAFNKSGLCIDVNNGNINSGTAVQGVDCRENDNNQVWIPI